MKKQFLVFFLFLGTIGFSFCQEQDTLTGTLEFISNPCTTEPCLPGVSVALRSDTADFFIIGASEKNEKIILGNQTFSEGDSISVICNIISKKDIYNAVYYEIDLEHIFLVSTNNDIIKKRNDIIFYLNPTNEYLIVKNKSDLILSWIKIIDINGRTIFSSEYYSNSIDISDLNYKGVGIINLTTSDNILITKKILF